MSRFARRNRTARYLPNLQIFKGTSPRTMPAFATKRFLSFAITRQCTAAAARTTYAIYSRSQNRILQIAQPLRAQYLPVAA